MRRLSLLFLISVFPNFFVNGLAQNTMSEEEKAKLKFMQSIRKHTTDAIVSGDWYSYYSPRKNNLHAGAETDNLRGDLSGRFYLLFHLEKCARETFNFITYSEEKHSKNYEFDLRMEFAFDDNAVIEEQARVFQRDGKIHSRLVVILDNSAKQKFVSLLQSASILRTKLHWSEERKEYGRFSLSGFTKSYRHAKQLCEKNSDSQYFN